MTPTLAFLIPSRGRFDRLLLTLTSLARHPDAARFEARVWFDDDDLSSLSRASEILSPGVHIHTGPRQLGYDSTGLFCTHMAESSTTPYFCICDDDNELEGGAFVDQLLSLPPTTYATPSIYALNDGLIHDVRAYAFLPNGCWHPDWTHILNPTDTRLYELLVTQRHWPIVRLPNVTMRHHWKARVVATPFSP